MLLQGNLPLEFKEGGTLLGRFWRGIWNWEDCFWLEDLKKEEKKKGNRRIFLFGNKFRSWGVIYICEKGWRKENSEDFFGESSWEKTQRWRRAHALKEGDVERILFLGGKIVLRRSIEGGIGSMHPHLAWSRAIFLKDWFFQVWSCEIRILSSPCDPKYYSASPGVILLIVVEISN